MCGLFGYITNKDTLLTVEQRKKRTRIAIALGISMETRGEDSTGISLIGKKYDILKAIKPASKFLPKIKNSFDFKHNLLIGHTRFATIGAITNRNAHPFLINNIIGAHNGSVDNYLTFDHKGEVDSEVIFAELGKQNNDYKNVLKRLSGSFALTWYNVGIEKLFIARNTNPLATAYIKEIDTIFWCSEAEYLKPIISTQFDLKKVKIDYPLADYVYEIDFSLKITKKKISFAARAYAGNYYNNGHYNDYDFKEEELSGVDDFEYCAYCGEPINEDETNFFSDELDCYFCPFCAEAASYDGANVVPIILNK